MSTSTLIRPSIKRFIQPRKTHYILPSFLLPSVLQQEASFSTTSSKFYPRDNNRQRGVSTQRRTGLRQPVSVSKTPLPKPVLDPAKRSKIEVDEDHPLWGFFHSKDKPMNTPEEDYAHGRAWCAEELRAKSWEDLHALWWVCCKELNIIATESYERERLEAGYGESESKTREKTVRRTQRAIKQVLTERYYSWQEAEKLARTDSEIDLSGNGPLYNPIDLLEEEAQETSEEREHEEQNIERDITTAPEVKGDNNMLLKSEESEGTSLSLGEKTKRITLKSAEEEGILSEPEVKQEQRPSSNV